MQRKTFLAAIVAALALPTAWAQGPSWPERPVKLILSQPPGSGPDNVARLLADGLAKQWGQGKLSLGNEGPRTFGGMIARVFNSRAKADANLVSYAAGGVSMQDLIGGHVDAIVADVASTAQLVKQGRLRMLATTSSKRVPGFETVPTLAERFPGVEMVGWFAVVAPVGTPQAPIERFNRDLNTLLAERDIAERIATIGPFAEAGLKPQQVAGFLRDEHSRWAQLTKEIGLLPE